MSEKEKIPSEYIPYQSLLLCSNNLQGVRVPFEFNGTPVLLIGKGQGTPRLWLSAFSHMKMNRADAMEWHSFYVVRDNAATRSGVEIQIDDDLRVSQVLISGQVVIAVQEKESNVAEVTYLDLSLLGFNIKGTSSGLKIGTNEFRQNSMSSVGVAFGLGPN